MRLPLDQEAGNLLMIRERHLAKLTMRHSYVKIRERHLAKLTMRPEITGLDDDKLCIRERHLAKLTMRPCDKPRDVTT